MGFGGGCVVELPRAGLPVVGPATVPREILTIRPGAGCIKIELIAGVGEVHTRSLKTAQFESGWLVIPTARWFEMVDEVCSADDEDDGRRVIVSAALNGMMVWIDCQKNPKHGYLYPEMLSINTVIG
jgi:hypothetical protein